MSEAPVNGHTTKANGHANGVPLIATGWAQCLLQQTTTLVDVYAALLKYAGATHGNAVKPEDCRTLLTTVYIALTKGNGNGGAH